MERLKDLKKGDYFTKRPIAEPTEKQVWVKGDYDRTLKAYSIYRFSDINDEHFMSGNTLINTEFTF